MISPRLRVYWLFLHFMMRISRVGGVMVVGNATSSDALSEDVNSGKFTIYNALAWDPPRSSWDMIHAITTGIPLVSLDYPYMSYNPCDEATVTVENIAPLLAKHNITAGDTWAAFTNIKKSHTSCGYTNRGFFYASVSTLTVQKLGASLLLVSASVWAEGEILMVPPNVDPHNGIVHGERAHIPSVVLQLEPDFDFPGPMGKASSRNEISSISVDLNQFEMLTVPFNPYHSMSLILVGAGNVGLSVYIALHLGSLYRHRGEMNKANLLLRYLILVPEMIAGIVQIFVAVDPVGVIHIFNFFTARALFSLKITLGVLSDLAMVLLCFDIYSAFNASSKMQVREKLIATTHCERNTLTSNTITPTLQLRHIDFNTLYSCN